MPRSELLFTYNSEPNDHFEPDTRSIFDIYQEDRQIRFRTATIRVEGIATENSTNQPLIGRLTTKLPGIDEAFADLTAPLRDELEADPAVAKHVNGENWWDLHRTVDVDGHQKIVHVVLRGGDSPKGANRAAVFVEGVKPYIVVDSQGARTKLKGVEGSMVANGTDKEFWARAINAFKGEKSSFIGPD